jgi:hypothetical protein
MLGRVGGVGSPSRVLLRLELSPLHTTNNKTQSTIESTGSATVRSSFLMFQGAKRSSSLMALVTLVQVRANLLPAALKDA